MADIVHRAAKVPSYALPTGANFGLSVLVDEGFDMDGKEVRVRVFPAGKEKGWEISSEDVGSEISISGQAITVDAVPASVGTVGTSRTLREMQFASECKWALDVLSGTELSWRIQGDISFLPRAGAIDGEFGDFPEISVSVNTDETISVTLNISGGGGSATPADGSITNAKLADMPEATFKMRAAGAGTGEPINGSNSQARAALGLGTTNDVDFGGAAIGTTGICDISPGGIITFSGGGTYDQVLAVGGAYIRRDGAVNAGAPGYVIEAGSVQPHLTSTQLKMGAAGAVGFTSNSGIGDPLDAYFSRHAAGVVNVHSFLRLVPTTFASLPAAATAGDGAIANITDGTASTLGGVATGSGSLKQTVRSDGTDWRVESGELGDASVTNAKLANMPEATFKMRAAGAGTGAPINGSNSQARTALGLAPTDSVSFAGVNFSESSYINANYAVFQSQDGLYLRNNAAVIRVGVSDDTGISRISDDLIAIGKGSAGAFSGGIKLTDLEAVRKIKITPTTFASLPAAATAGDGALANITDGTASTLGGVATGSGSLKQTVRSDGTDWRVMFTPV